MPELRKDLRTRFWVQTALACTTGFLFVLTLFWHDWLEAFGFDPDHGDGSAEWVIVAALLVCSVTFAIIARAEWRRTAPATT